MTHPRSAFGALAGRAGPEARPFGRHQRQAVGVRPQPQWPGKAGSTASAGLHGLTLDRRGLTGMSTGISTDMRTDWRLGELIC